MNEDRIRALVREQARKKVIIDSYSRTCDMLIELNQLNEFDISSLADSATSFIGDNLGGAFTDSLKQYLVELLFKRLQAMGLPTDPTSIVGRAIVNTVEELEWTNLSKYIKDENACGEIADVLMVGIQEGFQEEGIDAIFAVMFGEEGSRLGVGNSTTGLLGGPVRELINKKIEDMTEFLREPVKEFFCDHRDINKLIDGFKSNLPDLDGITSKSIDPGGATKKYSSDELYDMIGRGS